MIKSLLKKTPMYRWYTWFRYERWQPVEGKKETVILEKFQHNESIYLIQIGAYDGITGDPLSLLPDTIDINGVLVEPQKAAFKKLQDKYKGHKNISLENLAIADKDGDIVLYRPKGQEDSVLASFSEAHVRKHFEEPIDVITEKVKTATFTTLFKKHHIDHLHLLVVDTEGYDYEILKQIPFSLLKPQVIIYESVHLPIGTYQKSVELLRKHGYSIIRDGLDTIAFLD